MAQRYNVLFGKAIPNCIGATSIFSDAPSGTNLVLLTIRSGRLSVVFNYRVEGAPSVQGIGHDYGPTAGQPIQLFLSSSDAANVQAIGAASGYISYVQSYL